MAGFRPLGGGTPGRAGVGPLADRAPELKSGICTLQRARTRTRHADTRQYPCTKTRAVRISTHMPAGAQGRPCTQTHTYMHTQNTLTRAQVPGPIPFTQKLKDMFTCALTYMLRHVSTLISLRTLTCTRMFTPCTHKHMGRNTLVHL